MVWLRLHRGAEEVSSELTRMYVVVRILILLMTASGPALHRLQENAAVRHGADVAENDEGGEQALEEQRGSEKRKAKVTCVHES